MLVSSVKISQSCLEFVASNLGQKLSQTITVSNSMPETLLEVRWEVAPHPSDPPHTPDSHAWISFATTKLAKTSYDYRIAVDTSRLMADKTYERQILLHTKFLPEPYFLTVKVKTAQIPVKTKKMPYSYLALVFVASAIGAAAGAGVGAVAGVGAWAGVVAQAWAMAVTGVWAWAMNGAEAKPSAEAEAKPMVMVFAAIAAVVGATAGTVAVAAAVAVAVAAAVAVPVAVTVAMAVVVTADKNFVSIGFSKPFGIGILLLTIASGVSLGIGLILGFLNLFVISAVVGTSLLLATILLYLPLSRLKQIRKYRRKEEHLIRP